MQARVEGWGGFWRLKHHNSPIHQKTSLVLSGAAISTLSPALPKRGGFLRNKKWMGNPRRSKTKPATARPFSGGGRDVLRGFDAQEDPNQDSGTTWAAGEWRWNPSGPCGFEANEVNLGEDRL